MGDKLAIDFQHIQMVAGVRPKKDVPAREDGQYGPDDTEVFIAFCLPTVKPGSLLSATGQRQAMAVPVGEVSRPMADFLADANREPPA